MIYYLTYNEPFNGIFNSQVIDVVKHLRTEHNQDIRLISFLPLGFNMTYYRELKAKLKHTEPDCIIIPTVPVQYGWKFNWLLLTIVLLFCKKGSIISREVQATFLALKCRNAKIVHKVCYDARGANYAQMKEYDIYTDNIKKDTYAIESLALRCSDFKLAVSNNLVKYWKQTYNYSTNNYVVIPCTISDNENSEINNQDEIIYKRKLHGFSEEDIVLVFSGSNFAWQSFDLISNFCDLQLSHNSRLRIVFLSKNDEIIDSLQKKYPERVFCKWLAFNVVSDFLKICDYGILLRISNDTNNVASPTKFGEYLDAGLPVIISDNLEFASLVKEHDCGYIVNNNEIKPIEFSNLSKDKKKKIREIAKIYFLKKSNINKLSYNIILENLN